MFNNTFDKEVISTAKNHYMHESSKMKQDKENNSPDHTKDTRIAEQLSSTFSQSMSSINGGIIASGGVSTDTIVPDKISAINNGATST